MLNKKNSDSLVYLNLKYDHPSLFPKNIAIKNIMILYFPENKTL